MNVSTHFRHMEEYPYLFRLSYLYYVAIGFFTTVIVALLTNAVLKPNIPETINPDLFIPRIGRKLRRKQESKSVDMRRMNTTAPLE